MTRYTKMPIVTYESLSKAAYILEETFHVFKPFYGFSNETFFGLYQGVLLFVESMVYQADPEIEAGQRGAAHFFDVDPWLARRAIVLGLLKELELLTPEMEALTDSLGRYWQLENQLMAQATISYELIDQALQLRSSDLMLLHHILHALMGLPCRSEVFEALSAMETVFELEFDLREYEQDVADNNFNTYRMFVKLYGEEAYTRMKQEVAYRQQRFEQKVSSLTEELQEQLQACFVAERERRSIFPVPTPILAGFPLA